MESTDDSFDCFIIRSIRRSFDQVLDWTQLNEVADALRLEMFQPGATIIRENDEGDEFYLVEKGKVEVSSGQSWRLRHFLANNNNE
jgi:CRP-like cAMP-binding protein